MLYTATQKNYGKQLSYSTVSSPPSPPPSLGRSLRRHNEGSPHPFTPLFYCTRWVTACAMTPQWVVMRYNTYVCTFSIDSDPKAVRTVFLVNCSKVSRVQLYGLVRCCLQTKQEGDVSLGGKGIRERFNMIAQYDLIFPDEIRSEEKFWPMGVHQGLWIFRSGSLLSNPSCSVYLQGIPFSIRYIEFIGYEDTVTRFPGIWSYLLDTFLRLTPTSDYPNSLVEVSVMSNTISAWELSHTCVALDSSLPHRRMLTPLVSRTRQVSRVEWPHFMIAML